MDTDSGTAAERGQQAASGSDRAATAAAPVVPAGGVIYKVDSSRASFGELWRDTRSPSVVLAWLTKLLRVRIPGAVNDPNVESLRPFAVSAKALPDDVRAAMAPKLRELSGLGFDLRNTATAAVVDLVNANRHYVVAVGRTDGRAVARVTLRREGNRTPPKQHLHVDVISEPAGEGGRFVVTTGARASMDAPPEVTVGREPNGTALAVWRRHTAALGVTAVRPAVGRAGLMELIDRHHATVRDHHLRRRLFVPLSDAERATADAVAATFDAGAARGSASPEILAEIERVQANKAGWASSLVLLVVSVAAFVGLGLHGAGGDRPIGERVFELLAITVPILLVHEGGHYLAMRVFRYRNVRMFFIPGLGAAVSGQGYEAPGWKKVIVSLMGPLPGIVLGTALGVAGMWTHHPLLVKAAMLAVLLNGFNLVPVLPLDGGRVVQYLLFSRHWGLDVAFRAVAGGLLVAAGLVGGGRFLSYLGVGMLVSLPVTIKVGRIAAELKRGGMVPVATGDHRMAPDVADAIVERVRAGFTTKAGKLDKRVAARHTLAVYEAVCARPPGWAASLGFGALHGGALLLAVATGVVFALSANGMFDRAWDRFRDRQTMAELMHVNPPQYAVAAGDTAVVDRADPARAGERQTVIATFATGPAAGRAFEELRADVGPGQTMTRFGQTLLVAVPADDAAGRHRWLAAMERRSAAGVAVASAKSFAGTMRLSGTAPSPVAAEAVVAELQDYLGLPNQLGLLPPWTHHPLDAAEQDRARVARRTFVRVQGLRGQSYNDPKVAALAARQRTARRRGDTAEADALAKQQMTTAAAVYHDRLAALAVSADPAVDPDVVAAFLALPASAVPDDADDEDGGENTVSPFDYKGPAYRSMAERMGRAADPAEGALTGFAAADGATISVNFLNLSDPTTGAAEVLAWLSGRGVTNVRYEFDLPPADRE